MSIRAFHIDESAAHYARTQGAYHGPDMPDFETLMKTATDHAHAVATGNPGPPITVTLTAVDQDWNGHTVYSVTAMVNFPALVALS